MRKTYPSDITREPFNVIKRDLENAKKSTRPREIHLYEVLCAILYRLKTGCQWRALPHDFPDYRHVNYYYVSWTTKNEYRQSALDHVLAKLTEIYRYEIRENPTPTMLIINSKTIQTADTAKEKGYDGGKKSGIKIHIAVDVLGFPYAVYATTTNVGDRDGSIQMFSNQSFSLPTLETVLADGGYTGERFATAIHNVTGAKVIVAKRSQLHTFAVIPKRWIVERSFEWLDKSRLPWKNCERYLDNTLNSVKLAFVSVLLKRF